MRSSRPMADVSRGEYVVRMWVEMEGGGFLKAPIPCHLKYPSRHCCEGRVKATRQLTLNRGAEPECSTWANGATGALAHGRGVQPERHPPTVAGGEHGESLRRNLGAPRCKEQPPAEPARKWDPSPPTTRHLV